MDFGLTGKVAWVTAASRGIGAAAAYELAAEGAQVIMSSRNMDTLKPVAERIATDTGSSVTPIVSDNTDLASIEALVEQAETQIGPIEILVNNSLGPPTARFSEISDDEWEKSVNIKFMAQMRQARAVFNKMIAMGGGRIINIVGIHSRHPHAYAITAGIVNSALLNLTKALAEEGAPANILVNAVNPGPIETERIRYMCEVKAEIEGITVEEARQEMVSETMLKRFGEPREVAALIAFLASSRASFMTGCGIEVDGGLIRVL